ncbi:testis-expressed protein 47 isoform X2 [Lingula anatina]|uniref:Testis-expressed protein 47 isoform X2 n=1 Tax=Lingula anatina TaxID=7574 RepID=A0A1S3IV09_LINAN|nr:testis-expressed protein 47 isoform X2 [Lingula anatina]|eukprot:XP_013401908.1 testis-expressed protein 47 isoform X2 [Lingula anatina]
MATTFIDDRDSPFENDLKSLYDVIKERMEELEKKNLLHRLVYVGKLREDFCSSQEEIGHYYDNFFKNLHNSLQGEGITGLLLLYPKHCAHVVETSNEKITEVVRDMQKSIEKQEGPLEAAKILVISHDVPERLYNQWTHKILDIKSANLDLYEPSEAADKLVTDMLSQFLHLGTYLAKQPKLNFKNALDTLHEKVPEHLPQQDVINYLVENDTTCISKPVEYLNTYQKPIKVVLDSELTWPMPVKLFPYN